jgi:hypothetical protein
MTLINWLPKGMAFIKFLSLLIAKDRENLGMEIRQRDGIHVNLNVYYVGNSPSNDRFLLYASIDKNHELTRFNFFLVDFTHHYCQLNMYMLSFHFIWF